MEEKTHYTAEELQEFKELILEKLDKARKEYKSLEESLRETAENAADGYNLTEYGTDTQEKEQLELFMMRQAKFIDSLERALQRIENGTYGRCKVTGKLIPKERLRAVPHTEISIEAKLAQKKNTPSISPNTTEHLEEHED
jgi:RNA polymerase-binding protein DksA